VGAQEVGKAVHCWLAGGRTAALARVTEIRGVGSAAEGELFACNNAGDTAGGLLGGALAGPLCKAAAAVLARDRSAGFETLELRLDAADAARAGLSCGGRVSMIDPGMAAHESMVTLDVARSFVSLGDPELDRTVEGIACRPLATAESATRTSDHAGSSVLIEAFVPEPRLVIVGGGTLGDAIVAQAAMLGWAAVVAGDEVEADEGLDWAGASAAVVMLSHRADLDAPGLAAAVKRGVDYLGALGSRRTQQHRADRLRGLGVPEADSARIHGPVGLDLGGNRTEHIALAICAEILAHRSRRDRTPLRHRDSSIRGRGPDLDDAHGAPPGA
jgi:xanthine dehydrogenase accessory factor